MTVNDRMIATETKVTASLDWRPVSIYDATDVRTKRSRACSDFDVLHGLGGT
jgi:hypothetical protein